MEARPGSAVPSPDRPVTDPKQLVSPENPEAGPIAIADLAHSRGLVEAAWSIDGTAIFLVTNLTGRYNIWRTDPSGSWPVQLATSDDWQVDLTPSPDGRTLVFVQDDAGDEFFDLYAVPASGGPVRRLTTTPDVSEEAPQFSPGGDTLAMCVRKRNESSYNLALLDMATLAVRPLTDEQDPEFRWSIVRFSPDGRSIIANRTDSHRIRGSVWRIDLASGEAREVVAGEGARVFATDLSPDGRTLAITANILDGQLRAGLFDLEEGRFHWLAPTPWEQFSAAISPDGSSMIVMTNVDGRTSLSLVDVASMAESPLRFPAGLNVVFSRPFAPDGRSLLVYHAAADVCGELYVADIATGTSRRLTRLSLASLEPDGLPKSATVTYRSFDDTLVSAVVTMPFNLRRDGSNPAVVMPHGGPTSQSVDSFDRRATALASRGYLVIRPNFRGSTGYGRAFQEANLRDVGGGDLLDVLAARDFLIASGYVDAARIGITGTSYGGFMTLMALGKASDAFAAGVQECGIINWHTMWETSEGVLREYQRRLVGDPVEDAELYGVQSPLTWLPQARVPLLSLQGDNDIRVPRGQAEEVENLLRARGVTCETVFYPNEGHGLLKTENQLDALARTVAWFEAHLGPGG